MVAGGVGEHRAAAPLPDGLGRFAPLEEGIHLAPMLGRPDLEAQSRGDEPLLRHGRVDMTVTDGVLARRPAMLAALPIDGLDLHDVPPGLTAKGAGIHRKGAAQRAGDAGEELRRAETPFDALSGDTGTGDSGLAMHGLGPIALQPVQHAVRADDDSGDSAVAHQQVASESDPADRHIGRYALEECREIRPIARCEVDLRGSADVPGGMAAHRLVAADARQELACDRQHQAPLRGGRSTPRRSSSRCATALMLPAPMATITSPSRITSFSDSASSSTRSTKSGSTCPRLRTARQIARPSAPAMGASPAA